MRSECAKSHAVAAVGAHHPWYVRAWRDEGQHQTLRLGCEVAELLYELLALSEQEPIGARGRGTNCGDRDRRCSWLARPIRPRAAGKRGLPQRVYEACSPPRSARPGRAIGAFPSGPVALRSAVVCTLLKKWRILQFGASRIRSGLCLLTYRLCLPYLPLAPRGSPDSV